jgi:hypothetical protein
LRTGPIRSTCRCCHGIFVPLSGFHLSEGCRTLLLDVCRFSPANCLTGSFLRTHRASQNSRDASRHESPTSEIHFFGCSSSSEGRADSGEARQSIAGWRAPGTSVIGCGRRALIRKSSGLIGLPAAAMVIAARFVMRAGEACLPLLKASPALACRRSARF